MATHRTDVHGSCCWNSEQDGNWLDKIPCAIMHNLKTPLNTCKFTGIECGTLFDGISTVIQSARILLNESGTIIAVGPKQSVDFPANDCLVIDLSAKFVCPGFIDCHTHPFIRSPDYQVQ